MLSHSTHPKSTVKHEDLNMCGLQAGLCGPAPRHHSLLLTCSALTSTTALQHRSLLLTHSEAITPLQKYLPNYLRNLVNEDTHMLPYYLNLSHLLVLCAWAHEKKSGEFVQIGSIFWACQKDLTPLAFVDICIHVHIITCKHITHN